MGMNIAVIGGVAGGGFVLILLVLGCCCWRRKLKRARGGSTGKTIKMKKRPPKSWTQRLKRWTGHPTAMQVLTPEQDHRNDNTDADKHTTKVSVEPDGIVLDTNDASQKRFGTVERPCHKHASNPPTATRRNEDILSYASVKKEPLKTSANAPPAVAPRPDERKTYVSVKARVPNTTVRQVNEEVPNVTSVCDDSTKPDCNSPPAVAVRPDDKQYVSIKKYPTKMTVASSVEPPYVGKESESVEQPDYVVVEPTGIDVRPSAQTVHEGAESTLADTCPTEQPNYVVVKPTGVDVHSSAQTVQENTGVDTCPTEQPDYVVKPNSADIAHNDTEEPATAAEQPGYVDLTTGGVKGTPTTQLSGSSDTLLRRQAGRQHDSVTGKDDDNGKDARAGLQTWANRPEKADVVNDKATERNCMTYVSVVGEKETKLQGSTDCATYVSVFTAN